MATLKQECVECNVATLTLAGQAESGDLHLVHPISTGMLVVAVDGLGHGEEAAVAARVAVDALMESAEQLPLAMARHCHEKLRGTRGVVMSLAVFDSHANEMTWLGIGNVSGVLLRADPQAGDETLLLRGGVLGGQLPPLVAGVVQVYPGDTLILATDGIRPEFACGLGSRESLSRLAGRILAEHAREDDDALVLVARYAGGNAP